MKIKHLIVFVLVLLSEQLLAQTARSSVYSIYGIGDLQQKSTVQSQGMGFTTIGLSSPYWVNWANPAANSEVGGIYTHIFDIGFNYKNTLYKTNTSSESLSDGGLSYLNFWFRIRNNWTSNIGINTYSKVGYNIQNDNVVINTGDIYDITYDGSGGLNEFYFSNAVTVIPNLTLGAKLRFLFGSINKVENSLDNINQNAFVVDEQLSLSNLNVDLSAFYKFKREKYDLNVGTTFSTISDLSATSTKQMYDESYSVLYDESISSLTYQIPQKLGVGISFVNKKLVMAADIEKNWWNDVELDGITDLNDTYRYSAGLEYTPNRSSYVYPLNISYRLGYFIENSYLNIDDQSFDKTGFTAGLSFPFNSGNAINVSYLMQNNGTLNNGLIKETTNQFNIGVSFRNLWFRRTKYD